MEWFEWVVFVLKMLLAICGLSIGIKTNRHYKNGEYPQAIYNILFVILIIIYLGVGG